MSKITCEVCGTVFPDTASCCPICGWSPNGEQAKAEPDMGEFDVNAPKAPEAPAEPEGRQPRPRNSQQNRRIFDFDEANGPKVTSAATEDDDTPYYGGEPPMEEPPRKTNTALVVILVMFIVLVLLVTGILVVKFLLPGKKAEDTKATTNPTIIAETMETETTEPETTEAPTVPCTSLYAPTVNTLTKEGELWKLNVKASPEDTTDEITYASEDESVVTVSPEGNVTAVGNGTTNIVVTCGDQTVKCPVTVAIEETEPTTEATEAADATEETEATEETKSSSSSDVTLKLKRSDITFSRLGVYYTLQLDCDLSAEDITWRTSNSAIANVNNGVVTAMGPGIAKITAKYGDQEVSCIVRCKF